MRTLLVRREPNVGWSVLFLAVGLAVGGASGFVGLAVAIWNYTDPSQRALLDSATKGLLAFTSLANISPFAFALATPLYRRRSHSLSWAQALRTAAVCVCVSSAVSFMLVALLTEGL